MSNPSSADAGITTREREVWSLLAEHLTNRQIADELSLSVRTVESHVSSLMHKLQVPDRRTLARLVASTDTAPARPRWPEPASSFVGRVAECDGLRSALSVHRMVTVTGPGGVGKTRLVLRAVEEVAASRRDGGWFVDLVRVTDPAMVLSAVAAAVGVATPLRGSLEHAVATALAGSDGVLVLDNCEHVLDAVRREAEQLLDGCPSLSLVATSRVRLKAPYEWVYQVRGMSLAGESDAAVLFVERARSAGAVLPLDRRAVDLLCGALDGMALAIELAAARCPTLGLDGLIAGLDSRLRLLTTGAAVPARHRSLHDTIAWSYELLTREDRELFSALSVFASWFDAEAVAAVAAPQRDPAAVADGLARLADNSLLVAAAGDHTRYRALETIRQYGADQLLELGTREAVRGRHRDWCRSQLEALAGQAHDQPWVELLDQLTPDVQVAIMRTTEGRPDRPASELAELLAEQVLLRGSPGHCQRLYEQAADRSSGPSDRARLLRLAAGAAASRLVGNDTLSLLGRASSAAAAAGDHVAAASDLAWMSIYLRAAPGIIAVLPDPLQAEKCLTSARAQLAQAPERDSVRADAAITAAMAFGLPDGDPAVAELSHRAAELARGARAPLLESVALDGLCAHHLARGELAVALEQIERRGAVLDALPLDASSAYQFNDHLLMASEAHLAAGRLALAAEYADRLAALACYRDYPHPAMARRIKVHALAGELDDAAALGVRFRVAWERAGCPVSGTLNVTAYALAMVHGLLGDDEGRAAWVAVTHRLSVDPAQVAGCATGWAPTFDALLALDRGDHDEAMARLSADIDDDDVWVTFVAGMWRPWYAALWAEAAMLARAPDAASRLRRAVVATRENPVASAIVQRAVDLAHGDSVAVHRHRGTFARLGCDYQRRRTGALLTQYGGGQRP